MENNLCIVKVFNRDHDDDYVYEFPLQPEMQIALTKDKDKLAYVWKDLNNQNIIYVFTLFEESMDNKDKFREAACRCIFQNARKRAPTAKDKDDVEVFCTSCKVPFDLDTFAFHIKVAPEVNSIKENISQMQKQQQQAAQQKAAEQQRQEFLKQQQQKAKEPESPNVYPGLPTKYDWMDHASDMEELSKATIDFYIYDAKAQQYHLTVEGMTLYIRKYEVKNDEDGKLVLQLDKNKGKQSMVMVIDTAFEFKFNTEANYPFMTFQFPDPPEFVSLIFYDKEAAIDVYQKINEELTEQLLDEGAIDKEDRDSVLDQRLAASMQKCTINEAVDVSDVLDFKQDLNTPSAYLKPCKPSDNEYTLMADCYKYDKTFAVKGKSIGIFKKDEEDSAIKHKSNFRVIDLEKDEFAPSRVMLRHQDDKLLMVKHTANENEPDKVVEVDLVKQQVVAEYKPAPKLEDVNIEIDNIIPITKYANEDASQNLFAISNFRGIMCVDGRAKGGVTAPLDKLQYKGKTAPNFTCAATTANGELVSGSVDGVLRFYNAVPGLPTSKDKFAPKTAKCKIPGLGRPIYAVDVSADGKWVVATCKDYLLVLKAETEDGVSIFASRANDGNKPHFHVLQLNEQDIKAIGGKQNITFQPARFNTGNDGETWIVTSTGNYLITWSFKKVNTKDECYVLKALPDVVNCEQFASVSSSAPGSAAPVIAVLPKEIRMEKREKIKNKKNARLSFAPSVFDKIKKK